jgi:hypothetical protein
MANALLDAEPKPVYRQRTARHRRALATNTRPSQEIDTRSEEIAQLVRGHRTASRDRPTPELTDYADPRRQVSQ